MNRITLFGILLLVFFSCRNNIDEIGEKITTEEPIVIIDDYNPQVKLVEGVIFGKVYDELENPVAGATVAHSGEIYTTDEEGRFIISDQLLNQEGAFFTVEAESYFKGSRRIYPKEESENYVYVQLLTLDEIGSFEAASGGEIVGDDGLRITFLENSIQSSTGELYNGEVSVAAKWLDPTAPNIAEIMPGDLIGLNATIEEVSLISYGMAVVELFDENGNTVNIAEGSTATLSFPIPQELINEAPTEIPLWSFEDEQFGIWAEEGMATLQGDRYIGQVSHFSFWNCDVPFPLVTIKGQVVTVEGVPLANASLCICVDGSNRCGATDNRGFISAKVPADKDLTMKIGYQGQDCGFSSINVGSLSNDINLGLIPVPQTDAVFTISGSMVDCDNNPVTNGLVKIKIGETEVEYFLQGNNSFELALMNCDNATEVSIVATNFDTFEQSNMIVLPISSQVNFDAVSACGGEMSKYFTLNVDGQSSTNVSVLTATDKTNSGLMYIEVGNFLDTISEVNFIFRLELKTDVLGTYQESNISFLSIRTYAPTFMRRTNLFCFIDECTEVKSFEITITENKDTGDFFAGKFNGIGEFTDLDENVYTQPFSGDFEIPIE